MAFEELRAAALMLLEEVEKDPEDKHVLLEQLREKVSEMRTLGLQVPNDLLRFVDQLEQEEADDMFDNMPV